MITSMDIYDISEQLANHIYSTAIQDGIKEDSTINYSFTFADYPGTYDKDYTCLCLENMPGAYELIRWDENEGTLMIIQEDAR